MKYNVNDIIKILASNNYITSIESAFLKTNIENVRVRETSIDALRENLTISLNASKLTNRNIRDFKSLLISLENVNDNYILSIDITLGNRTRTIYIDRLLKKVFDEI